MPEQDRSTSSVDARGTGVGPRAAPLAIEVPALSTLPPARLHAMLMAGVEVLECLRVLKRGDLNLVGEVLRGHGTFYEYNHYPPDDVFDGESGAQYYYHAHRNDHAEHGHFHTFVRLPSTAAQSAVPTEVGPGRSADDEVVHLVGISMDAYGYPIGLFTTNRWVCGGAWRSAGETSQLLHRFRIDHAYPSWPVNHWISAMMILYRPHIEALLRHRDAVVSDWAWRHPDRDAMEDRDLEVTGSVPIAVEPWIEEVQTHCKLRGDSARTAL